MGKAEGFQLVMAAENIDINRQERVGDFPQSLLDRAPLPEAVMGEMGI